MNGYPNFNNFGEYLYWSYANLQMYYAALKMHLSEYDQLCYKIRAKYYKRYKDGVYHITDLFRFNEGKLKADNKYCWYCGKEVSSADDLTMDHIFPKSKGGDNSIDNIFLVCKACNSSKKDKDLIDWFFEKYEFIPMYFVTHYLKLIYLFAEKHELMGKHREELGKMNLPFNINNIRIHPYDLPTQDEYADEEFLPVLWREDSDV